MNHHITKIKREIGKMNKIEKGFIINEIYPSYLEGKTIHKRGEAFVQELTEYICSLTDNRMEYYHLDYDMGVMLKQKKLILYDKYVSYDLLGMIPYVIFPHCYIDKLLYENHKTPDFIIRKCIGNGRYVSEINKVLQYNRKKDRIITKNLAILPSELVEMVVEYAD
jgi:hypothetical protein